MENNIKLSQEEQTIKVKVGSVDFVEYEKFKAEALQVAEMVQSMEVTEDNIKETKKVLATVNKSVKRLEDRRIAIKKELLEPYKDFEKLVKEIVSIVKDADTEVRNKVRELEEIERQDKEIELKALWALRFPAYNFDFVEFDDFMDPAFLLKSATITKTEEKMVEYLERINSDLEVIDYMNDDRILRAYKDVLSVDKAIEIVKDLDKQKSQLEDQIDVQETTDTVPEFLKDRILISITKHDLDVVELLFEKHSIDYLIQS